MKTGGTCTLHKNYKTAQLGHTAGEIEVQPLSPSLTSLWIQTLEQTYFVYCVVLVCRPISNVQISKVTVYGS